MSLKLTPILICLVTVKLILGQYTMTKSEDCVVTGSSITLTCNTGTNVNSIQWTTPWSSFITSQGSGTSCTGTPPDKYQYSCSGGTIFSLTINNITFSYNGTEWKCEPAFGGGTPSNIVYIYILAPLVKVSITSESTPVKPGILTQLTCSTNPCYPEAVITWTLDGTEITDSITNPHEIINCTEVVTRSSLNKTFNTEDNGKSLVCSATNGEYNVSSNITLDIEESTTVGTTPSSTVVCVCDCTVALCVVQAAWMVVVVVYVILCLTVLKDFKSRWIVLVVFGFIQIVLGLISVGCLSIEHTCSSCKSDAYVAGAVFCALSLLCGTVVVIVVLLLKVIRKPPSGTLNVASEGKKRPPPEGQAETVITKDEKKSPQSVPPTATTTVNSSRQLPPDSGNVAGDEGKKPRPLPAPSGNVSPTVTSASQIDTDVNNEAQDDVMKTPGRLPPLEVTETETEKPKKKKKKKKSKKAEDHREKGEDSEEGNDNNQRE